MKNLKSKLHIYIEIEIEIERERDYIILEPHNPNTRLGHQLP